METFEDFLKQHNLQDKWANFTKPSIATYAEPQGWSLNPDEAMRDINYIINHCIHNTPKVNRFGIVSIAFEPINQEQTRSGIRINLEINGIAIAKNQDHIKKQLDEIMTSARKPLFSKGIYLQILYNKMDTSESVEENDNSPLGLVHTYHFRVLCVAIINKELHKNDREDISRIPPQMES